MSTTQKPTKKIIIKAAPNPQPTSIQKLEFRVQQVEELVQAMYQVVQFHLTDHRNKDAAAKEKVSCDPTGQLEDVDDRLTMVEEALAELSFAHEVGRAWAEAPDCSDPESPEYVNDECD